MGKRSRSSTPRPCSRIRAPSGSPIGSRSRWTSSTTWPGRSESCSGGDTRIVDRPQDRLDLLPEGLVGRGQRQLLSQRLEGLIDREARAARGGLEQHAARLAEIDRAEVEAIDHRCGAGAGRDHAVAPCLVVINLRSPGDVVHAARALQSPLARWLAVAPEASASIAPALPARLTGLARSDRLEAEGL